MKNFRVIIRTKIDPLCTMIDDSKMKFIIAIDGDHPDVDQDDKKEKFANHVLRSK